MTTITQGKGGIVVAAKQLIAGAGKHFTGTTPFILAGGTLTADQIATKLQALVDLRSDVDTAQAAAKAKLATEVAQAPALRAFTRQFRALVKASFATSPDVLADFGITPKVRAPLTLEEKAAAVAKSAATRSARHTMGARQKAAVKGNVVGVVITPTKAPAAVTAPSTPTTPATSAGPTALTTPHTA